MGNKHMKKIGRNEPCFCGSGLKFKKCCLNKKDEILQMVANDFEMQRRKAEDLKNMGIMINYVTPVNFKGKKVWGLGSRVYYDRPANETFHEFITHILKMTLGKDWWENQLVAEKKHFIMDCFIHSNEWIKNNAVKTENGLWSVKPDGFGKSLLSLAFDICSLSHTLQLPDFLLDRLRNYNEYQGVRYEIAIAAIFARLGFNIRFLDDKEKITIKHCEFIAKHKDTSSEIAVEVKSRHRQGVLHTDGIQNEKKNLKGDVQQLLNKALQQNPQDIPFMIFIDLNTPLTPKVDFTEKQWVKDINKFMGRYAAPSLTNPDPFNAIFFTNYSFHYQTDMEATAGEYLSIIPMIPKFNLTDNNLINMIMLALNNYGNVPNLD